MVDTKVQNVDPKVQNVSHKGLDKTADITKGQSKTAMHLVRATVARGRTVMVADGDPEIVGYGPDGKPLMAARKRLSSVRRRSYTARARGRSASKVRLFDRS